MSAVATKNDFIIMCMLALTEILQMNPKPASMFAFSWPSCKTDARC
jgi:hypothetical protein